VRRARNLVQDFDDWQELQHIEGSRRALLVHAGVHEKHEVQIVLDLMGVLAVLGLNALKSEALRCSQWRVKQA